MKVATQNCLKNGISIIKKYDFLLKSWFILVAKNSFRNKLRKFCPSSCADLKNLFLDYVESHLNKTFYNLTVVALHDCESYTKMRVLAKFRYGLTLWPNRLPHMSVDQGLDVLMIMRNINLFAANYCYDLNEQVKNLILKNTII